VIFVGIDDTDTEGKPGTNQLARRLIRLLEPDYKSPLAIRHQLLVDPRIPYTRKNSSASILLEARASPSLDELAARIRRAMIDASVAGSDPGLCVTDRVPAEITQFGRRCQTEVITQEEARRLAAQHAIYLEGLGGTEDGVIGALAAVGLAAGGNDGRVVHLAGCPEELSGPQDIDWLCARGVDEVRCLESDRVIGQGRVDVGKRLRPNYRGGRVVLFVRPSPEDLRDVAPWRAVRLA
jgi:tRNA(Ile2) C34 agmatinyltransferase TiaS